MILKSKYRNMYKPLEKIKSGGFYSGKIKERRIVKMDKNTYTLINRFECCGKMMVTVIIKDKAACVMPELEYNNIIETERKFKKKYGLKRSA